MARREEDRSILLEDRTIIFRNFSGKETQFNREGDRNFAVLLEEDLAKTLADNGWNVKVLKAREEDDEPQPYLQVSVSFKGRPPTIKLLTSHGRTDIDEETIQTLDMVDIEKCDMILNPYEWSVNGKSGIKAYLQTLYVFVREDALSRKYADLDMLPARAGRTDEGIE